MGSMISLGAETPKSFDGTFESLLPRYSTVMQWQLDNCGRQHSTYQYRAAQVKRYELC